MITIYPIVNLVDSIRRGLPLAVFDSSAAAHAGGVGGSPASAETAETLG